MKIKHKSQKIKSKEKAFATVGVLALAAVIILLLPPLNFEIPGDAFVLQEIRPSFLRPTKFHVVPRENVTDSVHLKLNNVIGDVVFHNLTVNDLKKIDVRVDYLADSLAADWTFDRVYAIDPSEANFEFAEVEVTAKGKYLYKCEDWDFDNRICDGNWKFLQETKPGEKYTLTITPKDPAFAEHSITKAPIIKFPGDPTEELFGSSSYDFSNFSHSAHSAHNGTSAAHPPATNIVGIEATTSAYYEISYSDDLRWYTRTLLDDNRFAWERFVFSVEELPQCITNLTISWEGFGIGRQGGGSFQYGANLYILNHTSPDWFELGTHSSSTDQVITSNFSGDLTDLVDSSGNLVLLAQATHSSNRFYRSQVWTDYVELVLDYNATVVTIDSVNALPNFVDPGQIVNITANIKESEYLGDVFVEIGGINYTMTQFSSNIWYYDEFNTSIGSAEQGQYNYTIYAGNLCGYDATPVSGTFTINSIISISLENTPINFSNVQVNQIGDALVGAGWPLRINNLGTNPISASIKGLDLIGQVNSSYLIGISNVTWSLTSGFATYYELTTEYALFNSSILASGYEEIYFKLYAPTGITTQNYVGNVSIFAMQA